jgi:hypothetical protein
MPIDVANENIFPLADLPEHLPTRHGKKKHRSLGFRWRKPGLRGVRLETIRVGGCLYTSREALQRFFERLSATDGVEKAAAPRTPAGRELTSCA